MSRAFATILGALVGLVLGFLAGVFGWMLFYYLVFMLPNGTPFRAMDQAAMLIIFTGPAGAVVGACVLGRLFPRWFCNTPNPEP